MTAAAEVKAPDIPRRWLVQEVWLVFALSLGASGVRSLLHLLADLTNGQALSAQNAVLNGSQAPGRPLLDLWLQLTDIASGLIPVLLVAHFLMRSGERFKDLGIDASRPRIDVLRGMAVAAAVGGAGLAFYLIVHASGANLTVVPEDLPNVWWRIPVLILSAAQNGIAEEVLVLGYLLRRLSQLGWSPTRALLLASTLRGSYHLYQGFGGFAANFVMGLIFGWLFLRWKRAMPFIVAHTLMDSVAFVGYALLAGHVGWLPTP
ncbi:MAG: family intrarane metalloprotease [Mycobacterium sp.]|jgi:membrane protease YdiL (CAAX protease family)|nr:family intrarane metalloprotease [Mycobacterium sp.]